MSKYIQRIVSKPVKFTFDVQILQVKMKMDTPCFIQVIWKRGSREIRTSRSVWLDHKVGEANFYEVLSLDSTLFQKNNSGLFQLNKKSEFYVIHLNGKYEKKVAYAAIDLSELVNQEISSHKEIELNLTKCDDKNAKIKFNISWNKLGEKEGFQEQSSILISKQTEYEWKDQKLSSIISTIHDDGSFDEQKSNQVHHIIDSDYQKKFEQEEQKKNVLLYINSTEEDEQEREDEPDGEEEKGEEQEEGDNKTEEKGKDNEDEETVGYFQKQKEKTNTNEEENVQSSWNSNNSMKHLQDTAETNKSVNVTEQSNDKDNDFETNVKEIESKLLEPNHNLITTPLQTNSKEKTLTDSTFKQEQIIDLMQQKNKIAADYRQLRATYQDCQEQLEILQDRQAQMQDMNEDLNLQKKKIIENQTKQQQQIIQFEQKLALKESVIVKLQKQIEFIQLSNTNQKIEEDIKIDDLKTKQLENQIQELKQQLDKAVIERESAQKEYHKRQIELQTSEFNHKQLQQEADKTQNELNRQLDYSKQEILKKDDQIVQMKQRLLEIIQSKKKNSLKDHQILERQRGKDEEYIKLLEKREKQMVDQTDKIDKMEEDLLQQKQECLEIQGRYDRLKEKMIEQMESKNNKLQALQEELTEIKKDDRYEQIQQYKLKNKELKELCKKQKLQQDKELEAWKNIVQKSKFELIKSQEYLKHNSEAKRFSLELATTEKQLLQLENQKLQSRIENLSNSTQNDTINRLIKELAKSDGENRVIKEQLIQFKLRVASEEQKVKDSLELIEEMQSQIQELNQDLQAIKKDNFRVKQKYGDALNICLDYGGPDLVDLIIKGPDIRTSDKKKRQSKSKPS